MHSDVLHDVDGREETRERQRRAAYAREVVEARCGRRCATTRRQDATETRRAEAAVVWHQEIFLD